MTVLEWCTPDGSCFVHSELWRSESVRCYSQVLWGSRVDNKAALPTNHIRRVYRPPYQYPWILQKGYPIRRLQAPPGLLRVTYSLVGHGVRNWKIRGNLLITSRGRQTLVLRAATSMLTHRDRGRSRKWHGDGSCHSND